MTSVNNASINQIHRKAPLCADVWFLSGATQPGDAIRHFPIDESPYEIGRKAGVSLKLGFSTVSGRHASLWLEDGKLHIKDYGSTNGTYVNGTRISDEVLVNEEDLIHFAEAPFRVRRQSPISQTAGTIARNVCEEALALVQFDRMMSEKLVRPHFQPIVDLTNDALAGYEILGRGRVFGLESVHAMFHAAEQLNLEVELSRLLRWEGIRLGRDIPDWPELFVNTHPKEIEDIDGLTESLNQVRELAEKTPLVLEIHEAAVTSRKKMKHLAAALNDLGIRLAFDDFGSGQARLAELVEAHARLR